MMAHMRTLSVSQKHWLSADVFDEGVALCQTVPGATAMQCAAYIGLRVRGLGGALATYIGFGLPAFLLMLGASIGYSNAVPFVVAQAALQGLRVAVIAIVASAAVDFARTSLKSIRAWVIAASAASLLILQSNPILVIMGASLAGVLLLPRNPRVPVAHYVNVEGGAAVRRFALVLVAGAGSMLLLFCLSPSLASVALVMMKVDVLAFGGGFTSLPLMFDEFVRSRGAVTARTFMDGIALGQVTPGPIVITATFLGYQVAGLIGATVATVSVFFPSFALVVGVTPWFAQLQRHPRFRAATRGATLSFVGLLVAVTVRFAQSVQWSIFQAIIAAVALAALQLKVKVYWVILASMVVVAYRLV
jgi:chromate transporter